MYRVVPKVRCLIFGTALNYAFIHVYYWKKVVAGDEKQAKSLLEWAKPKFPEKWLAWHYRSQYEELINFSNYAFYDKRVQIAPTVSTDKKSKPIEFIPVNGHWLNRSNRLEAEQIVETVPIPYRRSQKSKKW